MAVTTTPSAYNELKYYKRFVEEYIRETGFKPYMGASASSIIHVRNDLSTEGYTIRIPLRARLKAAGVTDGSTLSGNEEAFDMYYQDISWGFYRHAVRANKFEKEKSFVNYMEDVWTRLTDWSAELIKYQLVDKFHTMSDGSLYSAAAAGVRNTFITNNADRVLFGASIANGSSNVMATALATVDSTNDKLTTAVASLARRRARQAEPHIKPYKDANGKEHYVMFCQPRCFRDLKQDSVMVQANRDARPRDVADNPLFQDGDLVWDGIIFREIPEFEINRAGSGVNTSTLLAGVGASSIDVGVNFLCGTQALAFVNKQAPRKTALKEDDYDFVDGQGIELAHGIDKLRWSNGSGLNKDHGMVTVYASATPDT